MNRAALVCSFALLLPPPAAAQTLQSFDTLALRVDLDDRVRVEDRSGGSTTGRIIRLTRDEIAIQTDDGERRFTSATVRAVALRGHALGRSALIGAAAFAALGVAAAVAHGNDAAVGPLGAAAVGAGLGLAVGTLIPRMKPVYSAPAGPAPPPPARGAVASLLEDLALRVNLGDRLRVEDGSGATISGRLTGLADDDITIATDGGERHVARDAMRRVAVQRHPIRTAVLVGAAAGAVAGAWSACRGAERNECGDGVMILGGLGAGAGFAAGALIDRTTVVYPEPQTRTMVMPAISRQGVAVRVSRRW